MPRQKSRAPKGKSNNVQTQILATLKRISVSESYGTVPQYVDTFTFPHKRDNKVFTCIQAAAGGALITSSVSVPVVGAITHGLADLDNASSFAAIFDQYRIIGMEVCFTPTTSVNGNTDQGTFFTVIDYDDATNLASVGAANDYQNCIATPGYRPVARSYHPRTAAAAYSGAFTSYMNVGRAWIDCSSASVLYYGVKYYWTVTSSACVYRVQSRYLIQFRNTH